MFCIYSSFLNEGLRILILLIELHIERLRVTGNLIRTDQFNTDRRIRRGHTLPGTYYLIYLLNSFKSCESRVFDHFLKLQLCLQIVWHKTSFFFNIFFLNC